MKITVTALTPREAIEYTRRILPPTIRYTIPLTVRRTDNSTFEVYA